MSFGRIVSIVGSCGRRGRRKEKHDNVVLIYLVIGIKWNVILAYLEIYRKYANLCQGICGESENTKYNENGV